MSFRCKLSDGLKPRETNPCPKKETDKISLRISRLLELSFSMLEFFSIIYPTFN